MSKHVEIVSATSGKFYESLLGGSYFRYHQSQHISLRTYDYNKRPLSELYNEAIDKTKAKYLIFAHDDVSLEDHDYCNKIDQAIGDDSPYSICGVAGMTKARIANKNLWHLMSTSGKPFDGASGAVGHYTGKDDTECFMSNFGPMPQRVTLLDGVFLAINVKEVREAGLRFDENYPSPFHFYDLDFCLTANKLGLKMTTWPIWIIHKSHGLTSKSTKEWDEGNKYFINKWSKNNDK